MIDWKCEIPFNYIYDPVKYNNTYHLYFYILPLLLYEVDK